jgi:hypothetical protein
MKIGWSNFAIKQNEKGNHSTFNGKPDALIKLVKKHWDKRTPGTGRKDLSQVVVVPIEEKNLSKLFGCPWANINNVSHLRAKVTSRREGEDSYIEVHAKKGTRLPVSFAKIVLYSRDTLLENDGTCDGRFDWEIVALMCGPWDNEPMSPLTMARNFLEKNGGTFAPYTAKQFAESIYHWSQFTKVS